MFHLSLFTGTGGGELGAIKNGWHTVGYVEMDEFCQQVIARRIEDGILPAAPIFGDVQKFIDGGYAESYQGLVDVLSAGFPCQPFSIAGRREGESDRQGRNLWPATLSCIRIVRPRFAFLENVPGLLCGRRKANNRKRTQEASYFGRILGDLAEAGYDANWCVLGADDCGANHQRKRLWVLAYSS
jgi:DNA (cytosine-5)-methyltransferase 1